MAATTAAAPPAADRRAAAAETVLIVAGLAVLFFVLPHDLVGDDGTRFADIEQLLHHGHLTAGRYSLVGPLASAPLLLLGEVVKSPAWWAARFNLVVVAIGLAVAYRLTRGRVDAALFRTFALVLLFASFVTERLRDYGAEVFSGTLLALGLLAVAQRRHALAGWIAIVVATVNTPAVIGGVALAAAACAVRDRRLRPLLAPAAAAILVGAEDWLRRGSPFTTGYAGDHGVATLLPYSGRPGFSYPFLLGVASILVSFGRGLVFFMPGLLLWLGERTRRLAPAPDWLRLQLLLVAGLVLLYAKWWAWYGGGSWGPRFFVVAAVPASYLLAVRLRDRGGGGGLALATLAVLALSAWVGLAGALENAGHDAFCSQGNYQVEYVCWYVPDFSSLWWPVTHHPPASARNVVLAAWCLAVFGRLAVEPVRALARRGAGLPAWAHGWRF